MMTLLDRYLSGMSTRMNRKQYLAGIFLASFCMVVITIIGFPLIGLSPEETLKPTILIAAALYLPLQIRRGHDIGFDAIYLVLAFIAQLIHPSLIIIGMITSFFLIFWAGDKEPNKYGEKPGKMRWHEVLIGPMKKIGESSSNSPAI